MELEKSLWRAIAKVEQFGCLKLVHRHEIKAIADWPIFPGVLVGQCLELRRSCCWNDAGTCACLLACTIISKQVRFFSHWARLRPLPQLDWTSVKTRPWPGSISRVLVHLLMSRGSGQPRLDSGSPPAGWSPLPDAVVGAFGLPPICPPQSVFDVP